MAFYMNSIPYEQNILLKNTVFSNRLISSVSILLENYVKQFKMFGLLYCLANNTFKKM